MKLGKKGFCPGAFGLALGIVWGLSCFISGLMASGHATLVTPMASMYLGYGPGFMGSLIGGLWGLLHGFIAGFLMALIYNWICKCCKCRCCKGTACDSTSGCKSDCNCSCKCHDCKCCCTPEGSKGDKPKS